MALYKGHFHNLSCSCTTPNTWHNR